MAGFLVVAQLCAADQALRCDEDGRCAAGHTAESSMEHKAADDGQTAPKVTTLERYFFCETSTGRCDVPLGQGRYGADCVCAGVPGQTGEGRRWR